MARKRNDDVARRIGATARALRKAAGLTQEQLAEAVDLQPGAISRFENGAVGLSITTLVDVADALGVPLSRFFDVGSDHPTDDPDELALLDTWRRLPEPHRVHVRAVLRWACRDAAPLRRASSPSPGDTAADVHE